MAEIDNTSNTNKTSGAKIASVAYELPNKIVTNDDFAKYLDTSDEWITERTGIRTRHIGSTTSELSIKAGQKAIDNAKLTADNIDLIILATSTPDKAMPPTSSVIQNALGIRGGAMDINVACSGFVYALEIAHGLVSTTYRNILVIGADTMSKITDQNDRTTAVLFADGAGAVVVQKSDSDGLLASDLGSDGKYADILQCDFGGYIKMVGKEVYRQAVTVCVESIRKICEKAEVSPSDVTLFVPHQANIRIIDAITSRLDMKEDCAVVVLDKTGNTSAASIPIALGAALEDGRVNKNDLVVLCGFGAGMSWASQLWKWS